MPFKWYIIGSLLWFKHLNLLFKMSREYSTGYMSGLMLLSIIWSGGLHSTSTLSFYLWWIAKIRPTELQLDSTWRSLNTFYLYVVMESHQSKTTMIRLTGSHSNIQIKAIILYQKGLDYIQNWENFIHHSAGWDQNSSANQQRENVLWLIHGNLNKHIFIDCYKWMH